MTLHKKVQARHLAEAKKARWESEQRERKHKLGPQLPPLREAAAGGRCTYRAVKDM